MGKLFKLELVNPFDAAQEVISHWADKATVEVDAWAEEYKKEVLNAAQNAEKMANAAAKLGLWYSVLAQRAPEIGRIYAEMKREYKERLRSLRGRAAAAAPARRPVLVEVTR